MFPHFLVFLPAAPKLYFPIAGSQYLPSKEKLGENTESCFIFHSWMTGEKPTALPTDYAAMLFESLHNIH